MNLEARVKYLETCLLEMARAAATGQSVGIHCIKSYRAATGSALKDAKEWYDAIKTEDDLPRPCDEIIARIERLEECMRETNPGLAI